MTTPERRIDRRNAMTHTHTGECPRRCAIFDIQTRSRFRDTREYRFSIKPPQATGLRNAARSCDTPSRKHMRRARRLHNLHTVRPIAALASAMRHLPHRPPGAPRPTIRVVDRSTPARSTFSPLARVGAGLFTHPAPETRAGKPDCVSPAAASLRGLASRRPHELLSSCLSLAQAHRRLRPAMSWSRQRTIALPGYFLRRRRGAGSRVSARPRHSSPSRRTGHPATAPRDRSQPYAP